MKPLRAFKGMLGNAALREEITSPTQKLKLEKIIHDPPTYFDNNNDDLDLSQHPSPSHRQGFDERTPNPKDFRQLNIPSTLQQPYDNRSEAWHQFVRETKSPISQLTPASTNRHHGGAGEVLGNVTNKSGERQRVINQLEMNKVMESLEAKNAMSRPIDENAKREYSPVAPQGITSFRYEESKNPRPDENSNLEDKVPAGFIVQNKGLLRTDSSPDRFARDDQ